VNNSYFESNCVSRKMIVTRNLCRLVSHFSRPLPSILSVQRRVFKMEDVLTQMQQESPNRKKEIRELKRLVEELKDICEFELEEVEK